MSNYVRLAADARENLLKQLLASTHRVLSRARRRRRRAAEGRGLPAADAGAGEGVLVQLRDHAADEQPDAAVLVLIPGGPPARPTPGLAHYTPPRRRLKLCTLSNPAALQESPGPAPPPPEAGPEPERLVARARDGDAAVGRQSLRTERVASMA